MRQDITMADIDLVIKVNRLITQQTKGHNNKALWVNFDKEFIIYFNDNEVMKTINKIVALDCYNTIKL